MRNRACAALIIGNEILMIHIVREDEGLDYWTLPGGGLEPGESPIDAVRREVYEETGMLVHDFTWLFEDPDDSATCFLAFCSDKDAEAIRVPDIEQSIRETRWFDINSKKSDKQVSKVIAHAPYLLD
ncbi:MAG: NUDIX hydrolase [Planctomycetota bacterium]